MTQNNNELLELEQLKATYNKIDERLDGQEIVSDEQLRETMFDKLTNMRQTTKEGLIWSNLLIIPLFAWHWYTENDLTMLSSILLAVYWLATLLYKIFFLRKTAKEDFGSYDLKTLTEKESQYNKNTIRGSIAIVVFWAVFTIQWFLTKGRNGVMFVLAMLLIFFMAAFIRSVAIRVKYNGQAMDPATGKPRKLESKWVTYVLMGLIGLCLIGILAGIVMRMAQTDNLAALLDNLNMLPIIIGSVAFILAIIKTRKGASISLKLINTLVIIAMALCAGLAAVSILTTVGSTVSSGNILSTVCISCLAVTISKTKKQ